MSTTKGTIIFRQIQQPRPGNWSPGMHWYVEYHDSACDMAYPSGIAFVSAHSQMRKTLGHSAMLDFIFVCDQFRRQGIAKQLIAACRERWPDIELGDSISREGEALLNSIDAADAQNAAVQK